ncbi:helix-turn-helix domain-containing protein [Actinophytocola sediminis]
MTDGHRGGAGELTKPQHQARYCRCGARLAADNLSDQCGPCDRLNRDRLLAPPSVPVDVWDTAQLRDAFAAQHIGQVARAYRKHPHHAAVFGSGGISQALLGQWLGLTQAQVSRIETGAPVRNIDSLAHWARVLGIPSALLWFDLPGTRRTASSGQRADVPERLAFALAHPGSVDLVAVAHLREQVHALDSRYATVPATSLLAETGQCLGQVAFLRTHVFNGRIRRALLAAEAETATLMGQLVWDASQRRDHTTATAYLDQAELAANQLGDRAAEGLASLRKTYVALYGEKDPATGLALAQRTADTTAGVSRVLTGLGLLHAAEAHAMLGQQTECERALAEADSHLDQVDDTDAAFDLYSPTQSGRLAGSCYLSLGKAPRAEAILEATVNELRDQSKAQAITIGNLGLALIRQRRPEEAAAILHDAADVIERNWGGGALNVMFSACRELRPWKHEPAVQDIYDRVMTMMVPA